jgi:hypothetical protein
MYSSQTVNNGVRHSNKTTAKLAKTAKAPSPNF